MNIKNNWLYNHDVIELYKPRSVAKEILFLLGLEIVIKIKFIYIINFYC